MDNRPIGVFDSGLGGLTCLTALKKLLPGEDLIYFGDTGRMPYGSKTREQVRKMAVQNLEFMAEQNCKAVIAACGTVSGNAPDILKKFRIPAFGVVEPAAERTVRIPGSRPVAVIATEASIRSKGFENTLKALGEKREIISVSCPEFVPLIEEGKKSFDAEIQKAVETALSGLKEKAPCALILGCTHYGIIEKAISDFLGNDITIISASVCAAEAAAEKLQSAGLLSNRKNGGNVSFITSGKKSVFECLGSTLLGFEIDGYVTEISPAEVKIKKKM